MKGFKIFIAAFSAILLIAAGIRIYHVNKEFPQLKTEEVPRGEIVNLSGCDLKLTNFELDLPKNLEVNFGDSDALILVAELEIMNKTDETVSFPYISLVAECGAWSNSIDGDVFRDLNGFGLEQSQLSPKEKTTVRLGYVLLKSQFTPNAWKNIHTEAFSLSLLDYPSRTVFI